MNITNLALATDLVVAALDAETHEGGDHLAVATPSNPDFYWGNFLVLAAPPAPASLADWCARASAAFPASSHVALAWDGDDDDGGAATVAALVAAGFTIDRTLALVAAPQLVATSDAVRGRVGGLTPASFRPLVGDADWAKLAELGFAVEDGGEAYRRFVHRRLAARRRACDAGAARWWGGFVGDELVTSAGIVRSGRRARYQDVQTAIGHRRRRLASALLAEMAAAEAAAGCDQLVICVDVNNAAASAAYQQLGFVPGPVLVAACRAPAASGPQPRVEVAA